MDSFFAPVVDSAVPGETLG